MYRSALDVIKWNITAGKYKENPSLEDIEKQKALCQAEFNELLDEISIDGVTSDGFKAEAADLFVTTTYLEYMTKGEASNWALSKDYSLEEILTTIDEYMTAGRPEICADMVWELIHKVDAYTHLEAICKSNWTKIPTAEEFVGENLPRSPKGASEFLKKLGLMMDEEVKRIANKSKGRYTGIRGEVVTVKGEGMRVVFKDNNNKVLKPRTFKEYKEFL